MNLRHVRELNGRRRQVYLPRRGHAPGHDDVREGAVFPYFEARPNFYFFEGVTWRHGRAQLPPEGEGRPRWLPLYPEPRITIGRSVTDGWPSEPDFETGTGDWVRVIRQYVWSDPRTLADPSCNLRSEQLVGGWITGDFMHSAVWNCVIVPRDRIRTDRSAVTDSLRWNEQYDGYEAWGSNLWLGNTEPRPALLVRSS